MGTRTVGLMRVRRPLVTLTPQANEEGGSVRWRFRKPLGKLDDDARREALLELAEALRAVAEDVEQGSLAVGDV